MPGRRAGTAARGTQGALWSVLGPFGSACGPIGPSMYAGVPPGGGRRGAPGRSDLLGPGLRQVLLTTRPSCATGPASLGSTQSSPTSSPGLRKPWLPMTPTTDQACWNISTLRSDPCFLVHGQASLYFLCIEKQAVERKLGSPRLRKTQSGWTH